MCIYIGLDCETVVIFTNELNLKSRGGKRTWPLQIYVVLRPLTREQMRRWSYSVRTDPH